MVQKNRINNFGNICGVTDWKIKIKKGKETEIKM